ncbi:hypothetical protein G6L37_06060 [Agrobacterium rubi]|nr:hypothetical protein [Agrobacterium rubi]NTF24925.1 hypothetical protein [Agrobacterium rubi]
MAKVSITNQHDYMRFVVNFGSSKITGNFNRYEHTVKLAPFHGPTARAVSEVIDYVMKVSVNAPNGITPGQLFEAVEPAGVRAETPEQFVEFFKSEIEKLHGIVVRPFDVETKDSSTASVVKDGRGWKLNAQFENGDVISVKSSGKSLSMTMKPPISGIMDEISNLTFGYIAIGADPQQLMNAFAEHAAQATSTEDWIDSCRAGIIPGTVMKR